MKKFSFRRLGLALLSGAIVVGAGGFALPAGDAFAAKGKGDLVSLSEKTREKALVLVHGKGKVIDIPGAFSDVLVANPSLIDVSAIQSNRLYLVGLNIGDTNIVILDSVGNIVKRMDVHVQYDTVRIMEVLQDLFPNENVRVRAVNSQVVLTGRVSTPATANRIATIVSHYVSEIQDVSDKGVDEMIVNLMDVQAEQQVMLKMRVIEAGRDVIKELGIDPQINGIGDAGFTSRAGSGATAFGVLNGTGLTRDPMSAWTTVLESGINGIGDINLLLNLLEQDNLINILAEPNLSSISGEQAGFLAGGEFPVPIGRDRDGNVVVEFRSFGVSLNFRPTVMSPNRISLQLDAEVSSLSQENAITLQGLNVPGLDVRRAKTTVEMGSGATLMIAGLLKSEAIKGMSGLPGVKDTPIIGDLVKSDSFQREETELVILVTPYLIRPFRDQEQRPNVRPTKSSKGRPPMGSGSLERSFVKNMHKVYGAMLPKGIFPTGHEAYGYVID